MPELKPDLACNNLPLLPPEMELETKTVLKQATLTHRVLAELKGYAEQLPSKDIILGTITLQEAKDSSEIENIITTQDELYSQLASNQAVKNPAVKEVLAYRKALYKGFDIVKDKELLTVNTILEIQQELEQNNAGVRKLPGTKLMNDATGEVMYTPPDNEETIYTLLSNLEQFINRADDELDPLVKLAVMHYQFESIHPFYDGNGRTGRIMNVLYLVMEKLLSEPILYLSRYIIRHKSDYYRLLREVTFQNNWEDWILFMLTAVEDTSRFTLQLSQSIIAALDEVTARMKEKMPKYYSRELAELLFTNMYIKIAHLVDAGIASRNIAANYLKKLEGIGVLQSKKVGREVIYINKPLYALLQEI
jgi:Fic family protein